MVVTKQGVSFGPGLGKNATVPSPVSSGYAIKERLYTSVTDKHKACIQIISILTVLLSENNSSHVESSWKCISLIRLINHRQKYLILNTVQK